MAQQAQVVRHLNTAQNELAPCYQPQRQRRGNIADVMAALGDLRAHCALSAGRTRPQARVALQTPQPADQHHWPKSAAKLATSRGKVGHFNAAAKAVEQAGEQNCRVGQVVLLNAFAVEPFNAKKAKVIAAFDKRAKHRVAVKPWQTGPGDGGLLVHQRAHAAIANQCQGQIALCVHAASTLSQCRTAATSGRR